MMSMYHSDDSISRLLGTAQENLIRRLHNNLEMQGVPLTAEQFQVMCWLWEKDQVNQQYLANCIRRNRGSVTRILDVLERKGLVCRTCDEADRRVNRVCLTDEGRRWRENARAIADHTLQMAVANLDETAQENLRTYLLSIIECMDAQPQNE